MYLKMNMRLYSNIGAREVYCSTYNIVWWIYVHCFSSWELFISFHFHYVQPCHIKSQYWCILVGIPAIFIISQNVFFPATGACAKKRDKTVCHTLLHTLQLQIAFVFYIWWKVQQGHRSIMYQMLYNPAILFCGIKIFIFLYLPPPPPLPPKPVDFDWCSAGFQLRHTKCYHEGTKK